MDEEEMTYVEGGKYYSAKKCKDIICGLLMTPATFLAAASTAAVIAKVTKYASKVGGVLGTILGMAAGCVAGAMARVAYGLGYGAVSGDGVYINSTPAPWYCFVEVTFK